LAYRRKTKYKEVSGYPEKDLWSVAAKYFPSRNTVFQDDNAPVHRARSTVEYKLRNTTPAPSH